MSGEDPVLIGKHMTQLRKCMDDIRELQEKVDSILKGASVSYDVCETVMSMFEEDRSSINAKLDEILKIIKEST